MTKIYFMIKVYTHFTVNKPQNLYHLLLITLYKRQRRQGARWTSGTGETRDKGQGARHNALGIRDMG